ncbi:MAG: FHA domain-containing protein [Planctomycetota bacterium]|jgi:uncharacterized protein YkwD
MPFLKVFTNNEERTVFLGDDPIVFGRGDEADVLLKDVKVSREHCVIERDRHGRWRVLDLQSGNGTRVNGETIQSRILDPEDVVEVGDAKVLFAAEAVKVVEPQAPAPPPPPRAARAPEPAPAPRDAEDAPEPQERPGRGARQKKSSRGPIVFASVVVIGFALLALWWQGRSDEAAKTKEAKVEHVDGGGSETGTDKPQGPSADEILASLPKDLDVYARVRRLEEMLKQAEMIRRPGIAEALGMARDEERAVRERFFGDLEAIFSKQAENGEYGRAREIWFFLRGDEHWTPVPKLYRDRIIRSMMELEIEASAARTRLLNEVARAEDAHDFDHAEKLVRESLPRFRGTSVERNLRERLTEIARARKVGIDSPATKPPTRVRADTRKRMTALLARLEQREFAAVAEGMAKLAEEADDAKARVELQRRTAEVAAAAALHQRLLDDLAAGKISKKQYLKRWRVVTGSKDSLTVKTKGKELTYPWAEVPPALHLALLAERAQKGPVDTALGLAVAAHAMGGDAERAEAFALAYANEEARPELDRFVAEIVRNEPLPEGGYVIHEGRLLSKADYVRAEEEALIAKYKAQFEQSFAAIKADKSLSKLKKLIAKKEELDKRRNFALELIYDEKKYFYPYRHRANEYYPVQKEVDHRVEAVEEVWNDPAQVKVSASDSLKRTLKKFDEAATELDKRYVDVEEQVAEIAFIRAYFGQKFTIQTLFRSPEEKDLLDYSVEVMEWNTQVPGDILKNEREQVAVTNRYRMMFGRWPVRIVQKLVQSSRDHCEEMSRLGYFGHFSPTPGRKTPYDRMRLAGYQYGSSENIVAGTTDPKSAHQRWCHSSGHHRNLLMAPWTEMGTGAFGSMMCQNFGRAPKWSKTPPGTETEDDEDDSLAPGEDLDPDDGDDGTEKKDEGDDTFDYDDDE